MPVTEDIKSLPSLNMKHPDVVRADLAIFSFLYVVGSSTYLYQTMLLAVVYTHATHVQKKSGRRDETD
jgi:hypothetical protein